MKIIAKLDEIFEKTKFMNNKSRLILDVLLSQKPKTLRMDNL